MPAKVLSEDLENCIINFDCRLLVTDLINEYGGIIDDISKTLERHICAEEAKGIKFIKRFLIHGLEKDCDNEVLTVVDEDKLQECAAKSRETYSALYSVEIAGGTKSPASAFTPAKSWHIKLANLEVKQAAVKPPCTMNGTAGTSNKAESSRVIKPKGAEIKKGSVNAMFTSKKPPEASTSKSATESSKKSTAEEKKPISSALTDEKKGSIDKASTKDIKSKASVTKGIGNFFTKQQGVEKPKASVIKPRTAKPPTPKKYVSKEEPQPEDKNPSPSTTKPESHNISKNLFEDESSSDEDEKLDALKREVLSEDERMDEQDNSASISNKRRRIIDSDDDDEHKAGPDKKINRKDDADVEEIDDEEEKPTPFHSETFLDEDGFVLTIKAPVKKSSTPSSSRNTKSVRKSPQKPISTKGVKKEQPTKASPLAAKTKQGSITNFFNKK